MSLETLGSNYQELFKNQQVLAHFKQLIQELGTIEHFVQEAAKKNQTLITNVNSLNK